MNEWKTVSAFIGVGIVLAIPWVVVTTNISEPVQGQLIEHRQVIDTNADLKTELVLEHLGTVVTLYMLEFKRLEQRIEWLEKRLQKPIPEKIG